MDYPCLAYLGSFVEKVCRKDQSIVVTFRAKVCEKFHMNFLCLISETMNLKLLTKNSYMSTRLGYKSEVCFLREVKTLFLDSSQTCQTLSFIKTKTVIKTKDANPVRSANKNFYHPVEFC